MGYFSKTFFVIFALVFLGVARFASSQPLAADTPEADTVAAKPGFFSGSRLALNEGITASWLTRIIKQDGRSNFVFRDFLPGLYLGVELQNRWLFTPQIRLAAYYPMVSSFNLIPQKPKSPLHFGIDFFTGLEFGIDVVKIIHLSVSPGLHLLFLNQDRWNYLNLGIGGMAGVDLSLGRSWTILLNGLASLDNGNLGTNKKMEPFDIVYQYQVNVGVQYRSKKTR